MDLDCLNSATKYPSILTYHGLGEKGRLTEEVATFPDMAILTEKVDGTNGRIILPPGGDYFIGSREELLYAKGDRVSPQKPPENKSVVEALRPLAERLSKSLQGPRNTVYTFYLEVYGGKIGRNHGQYAKEGTLGFRLFDVSLFPSRVLDSDRSQIAWWRDEEEGQDWYDEERLALTATEQGIPLVPRLSARHGSSLPKSLEETYALLGEFLPETGVALEEGAGMQAEGIVIRDPGRKTIRKARFQDYERTLGIRK